MSERQAPRVTGSANGIDLGLARAKAGIDAT
jgi:hypothetical protein